MRETQPEHDEEIQAFGRWIVSPNSRRRGIGSSNGATQCDFIPPSEIQSHLKAGHRVEDLLNSLFGKEDGRTIDADVVREHYLRPFAILLCIGEGPMIKHFIHYPSLQDHRLPYRGCPEDFPLSPDPTFFERFQNQQWQFCAAELEYNRNIYLHKEEILPIIDKREIGHGGNAVIYKIVVHEEYDRLVPQRWELPESSSHPLHTYVLKTYRGPDAKEQHLAESQAFMNLRHDDKPTPCVIGYYGSFINIDDDVYNIILEFADRGNLEDYMKAVEPPSSVADMVEFWDRLFSITHGLAFIHGTPGGNNAGIPVLLGWHQDVKPANILVFGGNGSSNWDVSFKLADLSLCHFKQSESLLHNESDLDAFGTRAYGAPETFRPNDTKDFFPIQVRPEVDIWSTGCVFSEAAVWSCFGWNGVLEYRRQRQEEIKCACKLDGEHMFHDGYQVLKTVQKVHSNIALGSRGIDHVVVEVLRLLDEDMLLKENQTRSSAKEVYFKSRSIIGTIRETFQLSATNVMSKKDDEKGYLSDSEESPKTPPCVPPGYFNGVSSFSRSQAGALWSARPMSISSAMSNSSSLQGAISARQYHSRAYYNRHQHHQDDKGSASSPSDSYGFHDLPDPPSPTTSHISSNFDKFKALSIETQGLDHQPRHGRKHHESIGGISTKTKKIPPNNASLRRNQSEKPPSNIHHRYNLESLSDSVKGALSPAQDPKQPTPSSLVEQPKLRSSEVEEELKRPHLSLEEGLFWKNKRKRGESAPLPEENFVNLNKRDHIFIVDNSESMRAHRKDVVTVVSLLAYMLKALDSDGIDVCFTQSLQRINSGRSTKLSASVDQVNYMGVCDMRICLGRIMREYKDKFGTTTPLPGRWYKKVGFREAQKPLSFYVLTDGKWPPHDVGPVIKNLVDTMVEKKLPKEHVGIQFIRFGEDPQGIARLDRLDHGLGLKNIDMDIVDTTPWNGNVWKQLLGSISPWYDDDPD